MPTKTTPPHRDMLEGTPAGWRERVFLTLDEASAVSGVSRGTIYALHHRGLLRLHRIGGRTVVPPAGLVAALREAAEAWDPEKHGARGAAARAARRAAARPAEAA